ncbi:MAG: glycosyltransferase, partial [Ginsengibacter sp.]
MAAIKNVLFISYDGMTDPLGQSQVIPYLAGLTRYGYEFTIISCDKPENYNAHKKEVLDLIEKYPIKWRSIPYHKNPPVLSSVYDLYQIKKEIKKLQMVKNFDMVHTRPGLPTLAALWMKKKYGTKFLNDIRGFWADERVDGGMWNLKNPLYKRVYSFFKNHESECLEKSDYNVCLTQAARKEILSWENISNQPVKIEVIPCSADLELFNPDKIDDESKVKWATKLNIKNDDFVISYLGSIGGWYLTKEMMRFFKMFLEKFSSAKLLFISPHRHDEIKNAAVSAGIPLENLIITKAKRNEVPVLLSFSSYSLFFIKPCYSKLSSSPTKHG